MTPPAKPRQTSNLLAPGRCFGQSRAAVYARHGYLSKDVLVAALERHERCCSVFVIVPSHVASHTDEAAATSALAWLPQQVNWRVRLIVLFQLAPYWPL